MEHKNTLKKAKVALAGSFKVADNIQPITGILNANQTIEVSIRLRRKSPIDELLNSDTRITQEEYENNHGLSMDDVKLVENFLKEHHISVSFISVARRTVKAVGKIRDFEEAFNVQLNNHVDKNGFEFRGRSGDIFIPTYLQNIIEGVFGLDNRPVATTHHRLLDPDKFSALITPFKGLNPKDVANAYGFPSDADGTGECIAIIELGGGYRNTDLTNYFAMLGIEMPSVKSISVNGGANTPTGSPSGADGEVLLDIEVAGAVANKADFVVYFTSNTDQGFLDAITTAIHDTTNKPSVISISWGSAEKQWTKQALNNFNEAFKSASLLGVTICVAAGDNGSGDRVGDKKVHVDFPASSPYVLACGGTKLVLQSGKVSSEVVWNESAKGEGAGGGGVSEFFALPSYQLQAGVPVSASTKFKGRGVPDVAGNADPESGFVVTVDGQTAPIGGTSAVAPLMAAFIALTNQKKATRVGFINPALYAAPAGKTRDITVGNNISTPPGIGYTAKVGWDACTGWGILYNL